VGGRPWSKKEKQYLRKHYPNMVTWAIAMRLGRSERSVYGAAQKLGLTKSERFLKSDWGGVFQKGHRPSPETEFKPGHRPHNKGQKGFGAGGRSVETRFKKGNRPHTWQPVGSETIDSCGYKRRKVSDHGAPQQRWAFVHHILWTDHNGPIPPGHIVVFKNGLKDDIRIENLELITREENLRRNSLHRFPRELVDVIRIRGVLNRKINERGGR